MKSDLQQCSLRLPRPVWPDAVDLAGLFGVSVNQFLITAIREYVEMQLRQEPSRIAIERMREARRARPLETRAGRRPRPDVQPP